MPTIVCWRFASSTCPLGYGGKTSALRTHTFCVCGFGAHAALHALASIAPRPPARSLSCCPGG